MQRLILSTLLTLIIPFGNSYKIDSFEREFITETSEVMTLYQSIGLDGDIDYTLFEKAYNGYKSIEKEREILTIIDFSKPSTQERCYVIDISDQKLLFKTYVSHGRNSGENYATKFSNKPGSYQSSLGFYKTENTYTGKNGYSLILEGLEPGINDKAKERAIVIHGAPYCDPEVIKYSGRLGRSLGCPAFPTKLAKTIIDTIKDGSLLFIYADNSDYLNNSRYI